MIVPSTLVLGVLPIALPYDAKQGRVIEHRRQEVINRCPKLTVIRLVSWAKR